MMGWKLATIILSVVCFFLFVFVVVEAAIIVALLVIGTEIEEMEAECASEICGTAEHNSYYFDYSTGMCYCYAGDEVILEQKVEQCGRWL